MRTPLTRELLLLLLLLLQGSLCSAIDDCLLDDRLTNRPNYTNVLSLALGVARAMAHLHSEGVIHGGEIAEKVMFSFQANCVHIARAHGSSGHAAAVARLGGCWQPCCR
jgi:hypothetical protein